MTLHKAKNVINQDEPYLVMSRLEREMQEEEQEPKEYHYPTMSEELADRGMKQSDFI